MIYWFRVWHANPVIMDYRTGIWVETGAKSLGDYKKGRDLG